MCGVHFLPADIHPTNEKGFPITEFCVVRLRAVCGHPLHLPRATYFVFHLPIYSPTYDQLYHLNALTVTNLDLIAAH